MPQVKISHLHLLSRIRIFKERDRHRRLSYLMGASAVAKPLCVCSMHSIRTSSMQKSPFGTRAHSLTRAMSIMPLNREGWIGERGRGISRKRQWMSCPSPQSSLRLIAMELLPKPSTLEHCRRKRNGSIVGPIFLQIEWVSRIRIDLAIRWPFWNRPRRDFYAKEKPFDRLMSPNQQADKRAGGQTQTGFWLRRHMAFLRPSMASAVQFHSIVQWLQSAGELKTI